MWTLLVCFSLGKEIIRTKKRGRGKRDFVQIRKINPNKLVILKLSSLNP